MMREVGTVGSQCDPRKDNTIGSILIEAMIGPVPGDIFLKHSLSESDSIVNQF